MGPEKTVMPRYEIRHGDYGDFFFDTKIQISLPQQEVLRIMNGLETLIAAVKRALADG